MPRANGQLERLNRLIITCVATVSNEAADDWDSKISQVQWSLNNIEHSITKRTSYEIVFNKKGVGTYTTPLTREILELNEKLKLPDEREPVTELLSKNSEKMKTIFDKRRKRAKNYEPGELVMVKSDTPSTGQSRKLEPKYKGPYEIVKTLDKDRYLVQDIEDEQQSSRFYKAIVAVDRLKPIAKL